MSKPGTPQATPARKAASVDGMAAVLLGMMLVLGACQASGGSQTQSVAGTSVVPTAAASALCPTLPAAGTLTVETPNGSRRVLVHLPASAANGRAFPVVIVLHGLGDTSVGIELASEFSRKADKAGFIAVYPQAIGTPSRWDIAGANDTAFIGSLLTELEHDPCVDPLRIYAAGISWGGGMVDALGCRLSDRIAAIASISGVYGSGWQGPCVAIRPMPVIAFHGVIDPLVPYAGGSIIGSTADTAKVVPVETWAAGWAMLNHCKSGPIAQSAIGQVVPLFWQGCSAPVELYRINNGGHNWPGSALSSFDDPHTNLDIRATDLIWQFFSTQTLPQT